MKITPARNRRPHRLTRRAGLAAGTLVLAASCAAAGTATLTAPHTATGHAAAPGTTRVAWPADGGTPPPAALTPAPLGLPGLGGTAAAPPGAPAFVDMPLPLTSDSPQGIPVTVLDAYRHAVGVLAASQPGCRLPLALLAGIGKVESGQAEGGRVDAAGNALRPILGPVLDGAGGTAAIADTDHGTLDGDTAWDRAVGPMQFIPSTWRDWASDGNGDGVTDPENVYDASLGAARYLCAGHRDLATPAGVTAAILSYNYSSAYLALVESWMRVYGGTVPATADTPGTASPGVTPMAMAAMAPLPPRAAPPGGTAPAAGTPADGAPTAPATSTSTPPAVPAAPTQGGPAPATPTIPVPAHPVVVVPPVVVPPVVVPAAPVIPPVVIPPVVVPPVVIPPVVIPPIVVPHVAVPPVVLPPGDGGGDIAH